MPLLSVYPLSIKEIIHDISRLSGVPVADIVGPKRVGPVSAARHLAIYFSWRHTNHSVADIGRMFGNRHHTTVLNSIRRVERGLSAPSGQIPRPSKNDDGCGGPCTKSLECPFPMCVWDGYRPPELMSLDHAHGVAVFLPSGNHRMERK